MNDKSRTETHELARNSLPDELKPVFDELVDDYKFASFKKVGKPYVAYSILADIVRVGWRHTEEPLPESGEKEKHDSTEPN